jgi:hypothetical protein
MKTGVLTIKCTIDTEWCSGFQVKDYVFSFELKIRIQISNQIMKHSFSKVESVNHEVKHGNATLHKYFDFNCIRHIPEASEALYAVVLWYLCCFVRQDKK